MSQKSQSNFYLRLGAFIIDFSIVYGVAFIMYNLLQLFHIYFSTVNVTLVIALLYFPIITIFLGASFGKKIYGLKVKSSRKKQSSFLLFLREFLFKQLFYIIPIYWLKSHFDLEWLTPYFEILLAFFLSIILFVIFLFTKKTWYDQLAKTSVIKNKSFDRNSVKKGFVLLISICIVIFGFRTLFFLTTGSFNTPFIPNHSKKTTSPYVTFLKNQNNATDYILELFNKNDIVILCEGLHPEMTQYDFIYELISDKRFIKKVGNIYSEVGSSTQQANLDSLMSMRNLTMDEFESRLVNITRDYLHYPIWENTNYFNYLKRLYALNQTLPENLQIKHNFNDLECNWNEIKNKKDYQSKIKSNFIIRDKILAENILKSYENMLASNSDRRKCLVIMNSRHAFGAPKNKQVKVGDTGESCATLIMNKYPHTSTNVLMNTVKSSFGLSLSNLPPYVLPAQSTPIHEGIWDNAFAENGNKAVGFDLNDSPFGKDQFDLFLIPTLKKFNYQDIFNGMVFFKPLREHYFSYGYKNIIANGFDNEIIDRAIRIDDNDMDNNLAWWTHKVNILRNNEVTIDKNPYQETESVFELILSTILLSLALLLGFLRFIKTRVKAEN